MHGKKRAEYKAKLRDPKIAAGLAHKAQQWQALQTELKRRRTSNEPVSTLALLEKALLVNPDPQHLWNFRRETLLQMCNDGNDGMGTETEEQADRTTTTTKEDEDESKEKKQKPTGRIALADELTLTQSALQRNPKAYAAWFHRKWVVRLQTQTTLSAETPFFSFQSPTDLLREQLELVLRTEIALTAKLLQLDERNFHCWNYRRFVVSALAVATSRRGEPDGSWEGWFPEGVLNPMGPQIGVKDPSTNSQGVADVPRDLILSILQDEWKFTEEKIGQNFSNFSAFHYRGQLLPAMVATTTSGTVEEMAEHELQLVENAMCTEPDDQTAWWYQAFLLDWIQENRIDLRDRLQEQAELLRELQQESSGKWVRLGLFRLLRHLETGKESEGNQEQVDLLNELITIDPDRKGRYHELLLEASTVP